MKVKDLLKSLEGLDPELEVLSAKDDEGNGYHSAYMPSVAYCPELDQHWIETVIYEQDFENYEDYGLEEKPIKANCIIL
jgi:hypothetical protein